MTITRVTSDSRGFLKRFSAVRADEFRLAQELPHVGTLQPQPRPAGGGSDAGPRMPKHPQVTTVLRSYCFIG